MKRIVFMDLDVLDGMENRLAQDPDPVLVAKVDETLKRLKPALRDTVKMRIYDGLSTREIAVRLGKPEKEIIGMIYEAKRQLRIFLAEFVRERWGVETGDICRICAHPQRSIIEKILKSKSPVESWKKITDKVLEATGEKFHPPQILMAHLKHMRPAKDGNDG